MGLLVFLERPYAQGQGAGSGNDPGGRVAQGQAQDQRNGHSRHTPDPAEEIQLGPIEFGQGGIKPAEGGRGWAVVRGSGIVIFGQGLAPGNGFEPPF